MQEQQPDSRSNWAMLIALASAFALSQAFRTVTAMMAKQLEADFALTPQQLGIFAGTFHFAFGALQLLMGIGMDLHGVRRTVLAAFPLAIAGAVLSAMAGAFWLVVLGQALIGIGCAPAFLACTVFIARRFPATRFASVSGLVMGIGGLGLLATSTPLAWMLERSSWRTGFALLAGGAALAWIAVALFVRDRPGETQPRGTSAARAARESFSLFSMPHTWGIVALGAVTYASFITLRGLWLGPLLIDRYGFSLLASGNVALAVSVLSLFGPALFGRWDPGPARRRMRIVGFTLAMAALFGVLGWTRNTWLAVALVVASAFLSGYIVLQYADVRSAYPEALTGRALAVFTMAMFLGIAFMQWLTGVAATLAQQAQVDPFAAVMATSCAMLIAGAAAFRLLPSPRQ
ncbi:MFS transporter [Caenimonas soli]|uniref:MFS transporter n=1 Tax=Caenimonas soli TaxID=2735555 RepID=UPI001F1E2D61|nr:MFS transporter [Caenimonas soli]